MDSRNAVLHECAWRMSLGTFKEVGIARLIAASMQCLLRVPATGQYGHMRHFSLRRRLSATD
jgi:hypothetical protein